MKTYKDRLTAGLQALGWHVDPSDRSHYVAFTSPQLPGIKLFVGNAGALRKGRCASQSISIGDPTRPSKFYLRVLAACPAATAAPSLRNSIKSLAAEFGGTEVAEGIVVIQKEVV